MDSPRRPTETALDSARSRKTLQDSEAEALNRRAKILEIVTKGYLVMGREVPVREERALIVAAWEEIVAVIPTSRLQDSYTEAMRRHDGAGMIGAHELVQAWRDLSIPQPQEYRPPPPPPGGIATPEEVREIMSAVRAKIAASKREREARGRASDAFKHVGDTIEIPGPAKPERVIVDGFEQFEDDGEIPF